jgi:sulfatase maturation enzyme AslB (radical SAM superfamily)
MRTDTADHVAWTPVWDADQAMLVPAGRAPVALSLPGLTPARLARAETGWTLDDVRRAVFEAAGHRRGVQLTVAIADAATTPDELVEALRELVRLSLRVDGLSVEAVVEGTPTDPWLVAAGLDDLVSNERRGAASLERLRARWLALEGSRAELERTVRGLDDAPRRLVFQFLAAAWRKVDEGFSYPPDKVRAVDVADALLGERALWMKAFREYTFDYAPRLVVIPTWQCELRCTYCFIPKQDGRVMDRATMERSIDLLLGTELPAVWLQFFGGEALLEYELVRHGIDYLVDRGAALGKEVGAVVSSNGWSLDRAKLDWLAQRPVRLELSLDGDRWTQERFRPSRWQGQSSYDASIAQRVDDIVASGIDQYVIMVVHPTNVDKLPENFFHIVDLGFKHLQINNMLGRIWTPEQKKGWADALFAIAKELMRRWDRGEEVEFINLRHRPMAMRLNGEVTVDWDGTIYGGNGFLHETEHKETFAVGHLDDLTHIDRYFVDATNNSFLLDWSYRPKVTANNLEVGKVMASMCRWLRKQGYGPTGKLP